MTVMFWTCSSWPSFGQLRVVQIENVRQTLLRVVFRTDVLLLVRTVGTGALARVVHPAHQIVVVVFLADAREIGGEGSALHLVAFADGVAREAAARFEQFLAMRRVAWLVLGQRIGQRRLPQVGGDGFDLLVVQAEIRHLGGGAEIAGLLQPDGNPVLVQLQANILEIWTDLLHVLQQALGGAVELDNAQVEFAVGDLQRDGAIVQTIGFLVGLGGVGLLHQVDGLLQVVLFLLLDDA